MGPKKSLLDWPEIHFNILSWVKNNLHCSLSTEFSADHSQTGARGWVLQFVEKKEHKNNTHMQNCAHAVKSKRCANCCCRPKCKHMHVWPVNANQMSFVSVDGQTADCLYRWGERKHPAWTQWDARTGAGPLVVMACSSSNVDLAGWMQRVAAEVAVPQPTRGCVVVNQSRSPTLPLASLSGRKTV